MFVNLFKSQFVGILCFLGFVMLTSPAKAANEPYDPYEPKSPVKIAIVSLFVGFFPLGIASCNYSLLHHGEQGQLEPFQSREQVEKVVETEEELFESRPIPAQDE